MLVFKPSSQLVKIPVFAPVSVNVTAWDAWEIDPAPLEDVTPQSPDEQATT
jgi:hypothetical protein